jgi:uncharacterized protein YbjT (DUF2867 family)
VSVVKIAVAGGTGLVGSYVVEALRDSGDELVVVTRSKGADVVTGNGLETALQGVDVVVDVTNAPSTEREPATEFFVAAASNLQKAAAAQGVQRIVTLSIVGIDRAPDFGYYAAKLRHEEAALAGPVPAVVVRATQFHEFPAQVIGWTRKGPLAVVPTMQVQTVAARAVGRELAAIATDQQISGVVEIAGPEVARLPALARAIVRARHRRVYVLPLRAPGKSGAAMRSGALLPGGDARVIGPSFSEWLTTPDAARPPF